MNKGFIVIITILLAGHIACLFLPWWIIALVPLMVTYLYNTRESQGFLLSFLSVLLLWFVYSIWMNLPNSFILSDQIGDLLGGMNGIPLILVSSILAGLIGGLGGWVGSQLRKFTHPAKNLKTD